MDNSWFQMHPALPSVQDMRRQPADAPGFRAHAAASPHATGQLDAAASCSRSACRAPTASAGGKCIDGFLRMEEHHFC
jgi:hypothetical protein